MIYASYLQCIRPRRVLFLHTSNFDVLFNKFAITNFHSQNIRIRCPIASAGGFRLRTALWHERGRLSAPYHLVQSPPGLQHKDKSEKNNLYQLQLQTDTTLFNVAMCCVIEQTNQFEHGGEKLLN